MQIRGDFLIVRQPQKAGPVGCQAVGLLVFFACWFTQYAISQITTHLKSAILPNAMAIVELVSHEG